ncbi:hypothetical protein [Streptomyces sp. ODS05-4]|uniref:hypothetical protein n=1 Tax=Streptomyces sp. ODS05-4 TaxID=2944939 RepID=UPI002108FF6F|nr:hypothetical protein [Streptomyces sp. ODS05-4]
MDERETGAAEAAEATAADGGGDYCAGPAARPAPAVPAGAGEPYAACVLCQEPTEYPESVRGIVLCPVCEWQEAQRGACSG